VTAIHPLDVRLFSLGTACKLAYAEPRRVTVWYQRGIVQLGEVIGPKKRLLSTWDVLELAVMARLSALMVPAKDAANIAADGVAQLRKKRPLKVPTLEEVARELEKSGDTFGLFVFANRDNVGSYPSVQGAKMSFEFILEHGPHLASGPPTAAHTFVPIAQLLFGIVSNAADLIKPARWAANG
jgi:hypothetical protein